MSSTCQIYMSDVVAVSFYLKNNGIRGIINHTNRSFDDLNEMNKICGRQFSKWPTYTNNTLYQYSRIGILQINFRLMYVKSYSNGYLLYNADQKYEVMH